MKSSSLTRILFLSLLIPAAACGESGSTSGEQPAELPEPTEPLALTERDAPFDLGPIDAKYYEAVSYGPHPENLFDIYIPAANEPTPLLLYIHGGGFTGGSRDTTGHQQRVLAYLAEGIAYASIDYRLLQSPDPDGVLKPLSDSTRALQFIRYHASQLNIDRGRVILMGGSAGAGTSLFIAFHDEMADPDSDDPVERHSTRVTAAIAIATQATYDIGKWRTVVFEEWDVDLIGLAAILGLEQNLLDFYGITEVDDFDSPGILEYRERVDMLDMMDAGDPPFYVDNPKEPATFPIDVDLAFHHAYHALVLTEQAEAVGLDYVAYMKALDIADPSGEDDIAFALRHFGL